MASPSGQALLFLEHLSKFTLGIGGRGWDPPQGGIHLNPKSGHVSETVPVFQKEKTKDDKESGGSFREERRCENRADRSTGRPGAWSRWGSRLSGPQFPHLEGVVSKLPFLNIHNFKKPSYNVHLRLPHGSPRVTSVEGKASHSWWLQPTLLPFCVVGLPDGPRCSPLWPQARGQREKLSLAHVSQH